MERNARILIAYPILAKARLLAEIDQLACPEDWIEMVLQKALDERPEITELQKLRDAARKQADETWRTKYVR